ncbi:hypothetical protein HYH02_004561 [Chlamydomonas schloesseri]|uniref:Nuclear envelope membrane protein n=1 Tax=Chlamydomonas schloesseri TaxID=2026947 RepID=A0A835WP00_9CHLO|nr:hypothetical protein HYH02_004561 [Chlamydomonas schloesseri]|eukprot:KAG2450723.1 hypothetical protein HYH02_004561 [Chlamydomonas schloesseri]
MLRQAFALLAYAYGMAAVTYMCAWVWNLSTLVPQLAGYMPHTIDGKPFIDLGLSSTAARAGFNCLLILPLSIQHNIMARTKVKAHMRKVVPFAWERSVFVACAGTAVLTMMHLWQPMPQTVWKVLPPYDLLVVCGGVLAFVLFLSSTFAIDHLDLFGLRQAFTGADEHSYRYPGLVLNVFYTFVRHPLYLGLLTFLFCAPTMSAGRLLHALLCLAFVLWSVPLEERDLEAAMGPAYAHYRRSVPALIPALKPYKAETMMRKNM